MRPTRTVRVGLDLPVKMESAPSISPTALAWGTSVIRLPARTTVPASTTNLPSARRCRRSWSVSSWGPRWGGVTRTRIDYIRTISVRQAQIVSLFRMSGVCESLCDVSSGNPCQRDQFCSPVKSFYGGTGEGTCQPRADAGCAAGHPGYDEFGFCRSNADCACGLACIADLSLPQAYGSDGGAAFCERPCSSSGDCPGLFEICYGPVGHAFCRINTCSNGLNEGTSHSLGSAFSVDQICQNDSVGGTCLELRDSFPYRFADDHR